MNKSWNEPKTKKIEITLTEWEYANLEKAANYSKISINHWIRAILHEIFDEDFYEREDPK